MSSPPDIPFSTNAADAASVEAALFPPADNSADFSKLSGPELTDTIQRIRREKRARLEAKKVAEAQKALEDAADEELRQKREYLKRLLAAHTDDDLSDTTNPAVKEDKKTLTKNTEKLTQAPTRVALPRKGKNRAAFIAQVDDDIPSADEGSVADTDNPAIKEEKTTLTKKTAKRAPTRAGLPRKGKKRAAPVAYVIDDIPSGDEGSVAASIVVSRKRRVNSAEVVLDKPGSSHITSDNDIAPATKRRRTAKSTTTDKWSDVTAFDGNHPMRCALCVLKGSSCQVSTALVHTVDTWLASTEDRRPQSAVCKNCSIAHKPCSRRTTLEVVNAKATPTGVMLEMVRVLDNHLGAIVTKVDDILMELQRSE